MPVHNGMPWLKDAVESILKQTFENFEFIIVDDASTDATPEYLNSLADKRVRCIRSTVKRGITPALVDGVNLAHAPFIARMDADDIAHSTRFAEQFQLFQATPKLGVLGTDWQLINADGLNLVEERILPSSDSEIRLFAAWNSPFSHPTVMMRASVLRENGLNYDPSRPAAQDYGLWFDCLRYCKGANLKRSLLHYRKHDTNVSSVRREAQKAVRIDMSHRFLEKVLEEVGVPAAQMRALHCAMIGTAPESIEDRTCALRELFFNLRRWADENHPGQISRPFRHYLSKLVLNANIGHSSRASRLQALVYFSPSSIPRLWRILLKPSPLSLSALA